MNTRGLMELIVLNIGLELGVISPKLFAMMVIMALVTTMLPRRCCTRFFCHSTAKSAQAYRVIWSTLAAGIEL